MKLTPIQKLREDIKSVDTLVYLRVLTMLVEAEEQERLFLEKVFNDAYLNTEFEEYYKQFGKPK
jgi:translation initiation factor 2 beta subunit (eIF-2beta)/eIF-5